MGVNTQNDKTSEKSQINVTNEAIMIEDEITAITKTPLKLNKNEKDHLLQTSYLNASHIEQLDDQLVETVKKNYVVHHENAKKENLISKETTKSDDKSVCEVGTECDSRIFQTSVLEKTQHADCYALLFRKYQ